MRPSPDIIPQITDHFTRGRGLRGIPGLITQPNGMFTLRPPKVRLLAGHATRQRFPSFTVHELDPFSPDIKDRREWCAVAAQGDETSTFWYW